MEPVVLTARAAVSKFQKHLILPLPCNLQYITAIQGSRRGAQMTASKPELLRISADHQDVHRARGIAVQIGGGIFCGAWPARCCGRGIALQSGKNLRLSNRPARTC